MAGLRSGKKGIKNLLNVTVMVSGFTVIYAIIVYVLKHPACFMLRFHNEGVRSETFNLGLSQDTLIFLPALIQPRLSRSICTAVLPITVEDHMNLL